MNVDIWLEKVDDGKRELKAEQKELDTFRQEIEDLGE